MSSTLCLLRRRKTSSEGISAFISGFLAGFIGLSTRQKENRKIWSLFLLTRAIDSIYNSLVNRFIYKLTQIYLKF